MGTLGLLVTAEERDLCAQALDVAASHPQCGVPACPRYSETQAYKVNKGSPTPITGPVCKDPKNCAYAALHLTERWDRTTDPPAWAVVLTDEVRAYSGTVVELPDIGSYQIPQEWDEYDPEPGEVWMVTPPPPKPKGKRKG